MANNQRGNTKQAPKLVFNGNKFNHSKGFYQIPQEAADKLFNEFARKPAYLRLMLVLIGTEPGFGLSVKWITERTGMTQQTYYNTREELEKLGWLTCENDQVIVNFDKLYGRIESIGQKSSIESIGQKEEEVLASLSIESIGQKSKNDTNSIESIGQKEDKKQRGIESIHQKNGIESIGQMGGIESIHQKGEEYSVNRSNGYSVNTSKDSVNTDSSIESIHIIDNIDNSIDNLEYITMDDISRIVGGVTWLSEDVVKLPNGRMFRVKRTAQDWASIF